MISHRRTREKGEILLNEVEMSKISRKEVNSHQNYELMETIMQLTPRFVGTGETQFRYVELGH